jgi:hypothetical protein
MITTLQEQDKNLDFITASKKDIIDSITLEDVKNFLESLGVSQIAVNEEKQYLVCPTICHNPINEAESMKLYWYQNNKIFRCYTECNEAMSIFKLYQKYMALNHYPVTIEEAEDYVKQCLKHLIISSNKDPNNYTIDAERYKFKVNIPVLDEYPKSMLSYFTHYYHPAWLKDGITRESMDKFHIGFSLAQNKVIIPHFDINGRLIGIRGRAFNKEEAENFGKYRPLQIGKTIYTHPLQFNLYGIYEHKEGIKLRHQAIIAEAEKSVLLDDGYYGKYSNTVACCGSSFNKYHISMLTDILGASEIIVALDKEYTDWRTEKARKYKSRIEKMCKQYTNYATFSYIWDYDNVLEEKDSPFDKGKDVFEHLYKTRVKIK